MRTTAILFPAVAAALLASATTRADEPWDPEVGHWFVSPFVGYAFLDSDRLLDDNLYWGGSLGKHVSEHWSVQLTGYTGDYDNSGRKKPEWNWPAGFDASISGASFDLMRVFARESTISPYLLGGIGYQSDNYEGLENEENVTLAAGMGLMWDLWQSENGARSIQLRPELRGRWDMQSGDTYFDTLAQVGVAFQWGPARPPAPAPAEPPPPPPPPAPAKCMDADNDGVCDEADKCPGTPAGTTVDKYGCPCAQELKVLFDFDSAELRPESITELERVVKFMNDVSIATVLVEGHTDSKGSEAYNLALSDRRAKAVFDYLTSRGVDPARLKSVGLGESQPIAPNEIDGRDNPEGRQQNRRVMLIRTDSCGK